MRVQVNGVRLFFEIEGTKLRLTDDSFVEVPTLLLLHGGPGGDHSVYRPAFSALSDIAQIVLVLTLYSSTAGMLKLPIVSP